MKKEYTKPNMKIVSFNTEDVITVSNGTTQGTGAFGILTSSGVTYNSDK